MSRPSTALVTGGAGFVGSHLVERLLAEGCAVRVLDDLSAGHLENLPTAAALELLEGDVRDADILRRALADVEVVFHQAAVASVPRSVEDPLGTESVNTGGTLAVLEAARRAGTRRLVFAGSCAVYGDDAEMARRESLPVQPVSPYALQKHAGEAWCRLYRDLYGLETVVLRYFNIYGPRQDPASDYAAAIPLFVSAALEGRPITVFGDGEQTRDFVYAADVAEANWRAACIDDAAGDTLNIAGGRAVTVNELIRALRCCLGTDIPVRYGPPRPGDIRHSRADVSRAKSVLGFEAETPLEDGLQRTIEAHRSSRPATQESS